MLNCFARFTIIVNDKLKGHAISDYARNVMALGAMEHQAAGLSEPEG